MVRLYMLLQVEFLRKRLRANVAGEPLAGVYHEMPFNIGRLAKHFRTMGTMMIFLPCMDHLVGIKMRLVRKCFGTFFTLERLLSSMNSFVALQIGI